MKKIKVYLWVKLFLAISLLLLIVTIFSYFFFQNLINRQFGIFLVEDLGREKENFVENLKIILANQNIDNENKENNKIERFEQINNLLANNKYIVSCTIFLNRALIFSYNKSNFEFIPPPPPRFEIQRMENPIPSPFQFRRENKIYPPKLKSGFFMEQFIFRNAPFKVYTINIVFFNEAAKKFLEKLRLLFLVFYIILLIISFPISYFIAKQFTKPIRALVKKTISLSNGDYGDIIENKSNDELGLLVESFNKLSIQLKNDEQFRKKITSEVTHDISTPINIIRSYIYGIKDGIIDLCPETIMAIDQEIERINELVDQINIFSSNQNNQTDKIPLLSISEELEIYIEKILYLFNKENIEAKKDIDKDIYYKIRRNHLRSLVENLLKNSITHNINSIKTLEIYLYKNDKAENFISEVATRLKNQGYAYYNISSESNIGGKNKSKKESSFSLIIMDNGVGISENELGRIFERFYRAKNGITDKSKKTSGIGLSIVKEICTIYSINLQIYSKLEEGTTIILNF